MSGSSASASSIPKLGGSTTLNTLIVSTVGTGAWNSYIHNAIECEFFRDDAES